MVAGRDAVNDEYSKRGKGVWIYMYLDVGTQQGFEQQQKWHASRNVTFSSEQDGLEERDELGNKLGRYHNDTSMTVIWWPDGVGRGLVV